MSDQQVKVGIAGLGFAGVEHLKGYQEYSRSEVLAVCDLNQERAKQVAEEYEIPFIYTDHREMLANDDINTISVGLPNFLHAPVTIDSLNAGKHVLCEKPPARNAEEAIAMAEAAKAITAMGWIKSGKRSPRRKSWALPMRTLPVSKKPLKAWG